jgi:hypothetical protein
MKYIESMRQEAVSSCILFAKIPVLNVKWGFLGIFSFYGRYLTLLRLPPLRFHCVEGYRDRTQDCCGFGIDSQTLAEWLEF